MSATEVIELIKKLSPEEQAKVLSFVRATESSTDAEAEQRAIDQRGIEIGRAYMARHPELFRKLAQ